MTLEDGLTIDSRQEVEGDPGGETIRKALEGSLHWWMTVSSIVRPVLENAGSETFAMILGQRSVLQLLPDNTTRRSSLRKLLPGGVSTVSMVRSAMGEPIPKTYVKAAKLTVRGQDMGTIGFKRIDTMKRWYFLDGNEYYLRHAGRHIGPTVLVDTTPKDATAGDEFPEQFEEFARSRMFSDLLVIPHTSGSQAFLDRYAKWAKGHFRPARRHATSSLAPPPWDPNQPPNPFAYTLPIPTDADFRITGYFRDNQWQDPSEPEAARSLLESRFDLKLGFWDLVNNPILRSSLLMTKPRQAPPPGTTKIPKAASERAARTIEEKLERKKLETAELVAVGARLEPALIGLWKPIEPGIFRLELTEPVHRWLGDEPWPLVSITLTIVKRHTQASLSISLYNQVDLKSYVRNRKEALEQIGRHAEGAIVDLDAMHPILWKVPGGWGDQVDWETRAQSLLGMSKLWTSEFEDLCAACRIALSEREIPNRSDRFPD